MPRPHVLSVTAWLVLSFLSRTAPAVEKSAAWTETGTLPAPEAFQAAAADEQVRVRHRRTPGREVRPRDREARWRSAPAGQAPQQRLPVDRAELYCATRTTRRRRSGARSRLSTPETMELTDLPRSSETPAGSLTWAVRRGRPLVVQLRPLRRGERPDVSRDSSTTDWKEKGRWTYPGGPPRTREVQPLGRSLAGRRPAGHRPRRARDLPSSPSEVRARCWSWWKQSSPFTGQGIAADPKTGGLVGIDRAKRLVIFAERR